MTNTGPLAPSPWVADHLSLAPDGPALDVACGAGRHARLMARTGRSVDAVDRDVSRCLELGRSAARDRLPLRVICADLEGFPLPRRRYAVIVNTLYLDRRLVPHLVDALLPAGLLLFETFVIEQLATGHPRNPAFVLGPNELLHLVPGLRVLAYREGPVARDGATVHLASLAARAPSSP
jgi:SAM-dependent methyltransferase